MWNVTFFCLLIIILSFDNNNMILSDFKKSQFYIQVSWWHTAIYMDGRNTKAGQQNLEWIISWRSTELFRNEATRNQSECWWWELWFFFVRFKSMNSFLLKWPGNWPRSYQILSDPPGLAFFRQHLTMFCINVVIHLKNLNSKILQRVR